MAVPSILVTAPMVSVVRKVSVTGADGAPFRAGASEDTLDSQIFDVVRGARKAGADVHCVFAVEASVEAAVRARLEELGAHADLVIAGSASARDTTYVDPDGTTRFQVTEGLPPTSADVDRLLDQLGRRIEEKPTAVIAARDIEGGPRRDFAERVVGRAWGLGIRTVLVENGASLKQAFHTQPLAAWAEETELIAVSPPENAEAETPETPETPEQILTRIFEDPIRLMFVRRGDGELVAAVRAGLEPLGRPERFLPGAALGAFAAVMPKHGEEYLNAGREAYDIAIGLANEASG